MVSTVNHPMLPVAMPHNRATPSAQPSMTEAVDAAANAVAQDAMVSGFDAVAASEVRSARAGVTTSDGTSSPRRTRCAADSVRTPMITSTTAPAAPIATRTGATVTRAPAPSIPTAP